MHLRLYNCLTTAFEPLQNQAPTKLYENNFSVVMLVKFSSLSLDLGDVYTNVFSL